MKKKEYPYLDAMPWEKYQEHIFKTTSTQNVLDDPVQRRRVDVIKEWIGTGKKVLDIASGWGGIASEIKEQGNDVTILDMPDVIKKAKELHPQLKFLEGSVLSIPTDEEFDIVVATEIIEHILDLDRFFSEIHRVLKDEEKLIITTPNVSRPYNIVSLIKDHTTGWEYFGEPIIHCRHFTSQTFLATLDKYGFKPMEFVGTETNIGMDWAGFTKEEAEFLMKIVDKFTKHPSFRRSLMCVLCEKKK